MRTDGTAAKGGRRLFHIRVRTVRVQTVCSGRTLPLVLLRICKFSWHCPSISDSLCANSRTLGYRKNRRPPFAAVPGFGGGVLLLVLEMCLGMITVYMSLFQEVFPHILCGNSEVIGAKSHLLQFLGISYHIEGQACLVDHLFSCGVCYWSRSE